MAVYSVLATARSMHFGIGAQAGPGERAAAGEAEQRSGCTATAGGAPRACCRRRSATRQPPSPMPCHVPAGWWGFVFPLGVFSAATTRLYIHFPYLAAYRAVAAALT